MQDWINICSNIHNNYSSRHRTLHSVMSLLCKFLAAQKQWAVIVLGTCRVSCKSVEKFILLFSLFVQVLVLRIISRVLIAIHIWLPDKKTYSPESYFLLTVEDTRNLTGVCYNESQYDIKYYICIVRCLPCSTSKLFSFIFCACSLTYFHWIFLNIL